MIGARQSIASHIIPLLQGFISYILSELVAREISSREMRDEEFYFYIVISYSYENFQPNGRETNLGTYPPPLSALVRWPHRELPMPLTIFALPGPSPRPRSFRRSRRHSRAASADAVASRLYALPADAHADEPAHGPRPRTGSIRAFRSDEKEQEICGRLQILRSFAQESPAPLLAALRAARQAARAGAAGYDPVRHAALCRMVRTQTSITMTHQVATKPLARTKNGRPAPQ